MSLLPDLGSTIGGSLVAAPVSVSSPFDGLWLVQDGMALADAIGSGNWVEGARLIALHGQVREHFGAELTSLMAEVSRNEVRGVLYDAVFFICGFDDPTGAFGAAIAIGGGQWTSSVFGEHIAQDRTPEAIARSLDLIHEYARLILPNAYLERFARGVAAREAADGSRASSTADSREEVP